MKEHVVSLSSPLDDCYSYRAESLLDKHSFMHIHAGIGLIVSVHINLLVS